MHPSQTPALGAVEMYPGLHLEQYGLPNSEKLPGAQSLHTVGLFASKPWASDAVPAVQFVQTEAAPKEYLPMTQSEHRDWPASEYLPASQSWHALALVAPVLFWYLPGVHLTHTEKPVAAHDPGVQGMHTVSFGAAAPRLAEAVPSGQRVQTVARPKEYVPGTHSAQAEVASCAV